MASVPVALSIPRLKMMNTSAKEAVCHKICRRVISQCRSCDFTPENCFFLMSCYPCAYVSIIWLKRQKANPLENITWSDCENKKYKLNRSISRITPSLELVPSFPEIRHYRNYKGNGNKLSAQRLLGSFGWTSFSYDWLIMVALNTIDQS